METDKNETCVCGNQSSKLMKCSRCKNIGYCSKPCQIQDWPTHKLTCKKKVSGDSTVGASDSQKVETSGRPGVCQNCGALGPVKTCKGCHTATYCGRDCQRSDWGSHKLNCKGKLSGFVSMLESSVAPRLPGSLEKAKMIAARNFPFDKIIDSFYDMPDEFFFFRRPQSHVLVAFMFKAHPHFMRHGMYLKDKDGEQLPVLFYLDYDNPFPFFSWSDIIPGRYLCLRNAEWHHFMDGTTGIRIDEACDVKVINLSSFF